MYGTGQGLNDGVRTAAGFVFDAMKMKQQKAQFDAAHAQQQGQFDTSMAQRQKEHEDTMPVYHDRMLMDATWKQFMYGDLPGSEMSETTKSPSTPPVGPAPTVDYSALPTPPGPSPSVSPRPEVTTLPMEMTPAQHLLPAQRIVAKPAREFMPSTMSASSPRWRR